MAVLQDLSNAELIAIIERQREAAQRKLTCKVSKAGAVSVYGLGRWPVTLYASQMERLLAEATVISQFMIDNAEQLSRKD